MSRPERSKIGNRNPKIGALAPIRVVNELLATGDGAHGVRTAAFNLPNDERIVRAMGEQLERSRRFADRRPRSAIFQDEQLFLAP